MAASLPDATPAADDVLLGRFLVERDTRAFEALVRRHGPMVMALARRIGLQEADAEDACQATFLTLVRKAGTIARKTALASWLYKVAYRIALEQRDRVKSRQTKEHALTGSEPAPMEKNLAEFWSLLDAELVQLPEKYRVPFVLCHLQGLTLNEAAAQIGRPLGTVGTRVARARQLLQARLAKRGLVLAGATLAAYEAQTSAAEASLAQPVLDTTLRMALRYQTATAAAVSANVLALSDGAVRAIRLAKVKSLSLVATVLVALGITAALTVPLLLDNETLRTIDDEPPKDWLAFWGTVIDPDRDGAFHATRATLTMRIPGVAHVFAEHGPRNAPRVMRMIQGDFALQVKVSVALLPPAPTGFDKNLFMADGRANFLNTSAFHGAGIIIWQDDDNFLKVTQGSLVQAESSDRYVAWQALRAGTAHHRGVILPKAAEFPFVRVQRLGPHLFAACSPDGEAWRYLPTLTGDFAESLQVGLLAEHNMAQALATTFSDFKVRRFHFGNNPQPPRGPGPPQPHGCAKCHDKDAPKLDTDFLLHWKAEP